MYGLESRLWDWNLRRAGAQPSHPGAAGGHVQQLPELKRVTTIKRPLALLLAAGLAVSCSGGGSGGNASPTAPTPAAPPTAVVQARTYTGPVAGAMTIRLTVVPTTSATNICTFRRDFRGALTLTLTEGPGGTVTGTGVTTGTETEVEITGPPLCTSTFGTASFIWNRPLNGTSADISFAGEAIRTTVPGTVTNTITFAGSLREGVVSGTLTVTDAQNLRNPHPQVSSVTGGGSATFPVTLR
jgi:hypothetical protein